MNETPDLSQHLAALEAERARCLAATDVAGLRRLLSPQLQHVHTKGNVDDLAGYLRFVQEVAEVIELRRGPLTVRPLGADVALMTGHQTNRSRGRATGAEVTTEAQVVQVWAREPDGHWRIAFFQGTPRVAPSR